MKKIFLAFILLITSNVWAEWTYISKIGGDTDYIDFKTVKKVGQTVKFWNLVDFKKVQLLVDKPYLSFRQFKEINCSNNTQRSLYLIFSDGNMGDGQVIYSGDSDNKHAPIAPETIASFEQEILCK